MRAPGATVTWLPGSADVLRDGIIDGAGFGILPLEWAEPEAIGRDVSRS